MYPDNYEKNQNTDWESIFERILGSPKPPLSHHMLSRHLNQTNAGLDPDSAWERVTGGSAIGDLFLVEVEWYPGINRKYYFIPRRRFVDAGRAFLPFWSYAYEDILHGNGWFDRSELYDRTRERSRDDVPNWAIDAIDNYLPALTPAVEHKQLSRNTSIRNDTRALYANLAEITGPSEGEFTLPQDRETISL